MDNIKDYTGLPVGMDKKYAQLGAPDIVNVLMAILALTGGGGGGGTATSANQVTQIGLEGDIKTNTLNLVTLETAGNAILGAINNKLNTLGQKNLANSLPVVIASDQSNVPVSNASLTSLDSKIPTVSQKTMALSSPVVIASDQSAIPVTSATLALESTQSAMNAKMGTLGQKTMAGSAPVVIASDQPAIGVSIGGTSTVMPCLNAAGGGFSALYSAVISLATVNNTLVKSTPASIGNIVVANTGATIIYFKIFNKATAPIAGTDTPVLVYMIKAGDSLVLPFNTILRMTTGLGYAITANPALLDNTAILAGQAITSIYYA